MLPSFLLSLREGLEAALIIGIVMGVLNKIQRPDLKPVVWGGAVSAIICEYCRSGFADKAWCGI